MEETLNGIDVGGTHFPPIIARTLSLSIRLFMCICFSLSVFLFVSISPFFVSFIVRFYFSPSISMAFSVLCLGRRLYDQCRASQSPCLTLMYPQFQLRY